MAVIGVGIDVVEIDRFEASLDRTPGLRERLFTPAEATRGPASLAARFAAKEAVAKALGAPVGMAWHDAEVVSEDSGRPRLELRGTVARPRRRPRRHLRPPLPLPRRRHRVGRGGPRGRLRRVVCLSRAAAVVRHTTRRPRAMQVGGDSSGSCRSS